MKRLGISGSIGVSGASAAAKKNEKQAEVKTGTVWPREIGGNRMLRREERRERASEAATRAFWAIKAPERKQSV